MTIRAATEADAPRLAELHGSRISEGFLPTLGPAFLRRLYRRIVLSDGAFAYVGTDEADVDRGAGAVLGFAAAALDLRALYRTFLLHDGLLAGVSAAPRLVKSWRRVLETLRYPDAGTDLPKAEILAVAVDAAAGGRGLGTQLVEATTAELQRRGVHAAKVVTTPDNVAALRMYERSGFVRHTSTEVHGGTTSQVLVWSSRAR